MGKMQEARDALATYVAIYTNPVHSSEEADAARRIAALAVNKITYNPSMRGKILKEIAHELDAIYNLALDEELNNDWTIGLSTYVSTATGNEKYTVKSKPHLPEESQGGLPTRGESLLRTGGEARRAPLSAT